VAAAAAAASVDGGHVGSTAASPHRVCGLLKQ
jgi:hypothetical protein